MKGWKRIALIVSVLIGSSAFFGYWTINQFNQAFDNISDPYLTNTLIATSSPQNDSALTPASPKIYGELATPTDSL